MFLWLYLGRLKATEPSNPWHHSDQDSRFMSVCKVTGLGRVLARTHIVDFISESTAFLPFLVMSLGRWACNLPIMAFTIIVLASVWSVGWVQTALALMLQTSSWDPRPGYLAGLKRIVQHSFQKDPAGQDGKVSIDQVVLDYRKHNGSYFRSCISVNEVWQMAPSTA